MLKCNLNIGPGALIIAEREYLNKQRHVAQWERSLDASIISMWETSRIILLLQHFVPQLTEFGWPHPTKTWSRIPALQINTTPKYQAGCRNTSFRVVLIMCNFAVT
ncbi:hypothetical protein XENORESO_021030 [Xenotaenia resolanae]|uniref:Uncharacterized protein n=1 Tax=Xenotaenia resolanae TaxID=208358 RepID=A0ABV0VPA1_9TELE